MNGIALTKWPPRHMPVAAKVSGSVEIRSCRSRVNPPAIRPLQLLRELSKSIANLASYLTVISVALRTR